MSLQLGLRQWSYNVWKTLGLRGGYENSTITGLHRQQLLIQTHSVNEVVPQILKQSAATFAFSE